MPEGSESFSNGQVEGYTKRHKETHKRSKNQLVGHKTGHKMGHIQDLRGCMREIQKESVHRE